MSSRAWSSSSRALAARKLDIRGVPTSTATAALATQLGIRLTSLDEAAISHEAVFAADRSAELGRPVKMTELKRYAK